MMIMMMSTIMKCWCWCLIYDSKQKRPALHTSERTIVPRTVIFSSEGALIAITPLFEHTPVLDNNLSINAMLTLVTMITMMSEITKITWNVKLHEIWNDTKCQVQVQVQVYISGLLQAIHTGYCWITMVNCCSSNPGTHIGKPVFRDDPDIYCSCWCSNLFLRNSAVPRSKAE